MNYWEILGIERTDDLQMVRKAYAEKSKIYHPETHPEEFEQLHKAYKAIVAATRRGDYNQYMPQNTEFTEVQRVTEPEKPISQNEEFLLQVEREAEKRDLKNSKIPQLTEFERMLTNEVFDRYWRQFILSDFFLDRQYEPELINVMAGMISDRLLFVARNKGAFWFYLPMVYMVIAYGCIFDKLWNRKINENVYKKEQLVVLAEAFRLDDVHGNMDVIESDEKYLGERFAFYVYRNILELLESEKPDREKMKEWLIDGLKQQNTSHLLEITHHNIKERYWINAKEHRAREKIVRSPIIYDLIAHLIKSDHVNAHIFREVLWDVFQMDLEDYAPEEKEILRLMLEDKMREDAEVGKREPKIEEIVPKVESTPKVMQTNRVFDTSVKTAQSVKKHPKKNSKNSAKVKMLHFEIPEEYQNTTNILICDYCNMSFTILGIVCILLGLLFGIGTSYGMFLTANEASDYLLVCAFISLGACFVGMGVLFGLYMKNCVVIFHETGIWYRNVLGKIYQFADEEVKGYVITDVYVYRHAKHHYITIKTNNKMLWVNYNCNHFYEAKELVRKKYRAL